MRKVKVFIGLMVMLVVCFMFAGCDEIQQESTFEEFSTRDTIIKAMNIYLHGNLNEKGEVIYNTNPTNKQRLIQCAIIMSETNSGTTEICNKLYNVGGLVDLPNNKFKKYDSIDDSIIDMSKIITQIMNESPTQSIESCIGKYAVRNNPNIESHPDDLNRFIASVMFCYNTLTKYNMW